MRESYISMWIMQAVYFTVCGQLFKKISRRPIIRIKRRRQYKNPIKRIKHVIIDEVQDCSAVELLVITNLYEKSSFTLLGDTNQAINYLTGLEKLDDITIPGASLVNRRS